MLKKLLPALLLTFFVAESQAQVTLTGANFNPHIGDAFITINSTPDGISPGASGAGSVWNFSSLDTVSIDTGMVQSCGSSMVNPPCSWAVGNPALIVNTLPIVTFSSNIINYMYGDGTRLSQYGFHISASEYGYYTTPMDIIRYPFTYPNAFTDAYAGIVNYVPAGTGIPISANVKGTVSVTCDAYGTLTIPGNTYNNVLRVHNTQVYVDSANIFGTGIADSFQLDTYTWYDTGIHTGLLNISFAAQLGVTGLMDTTVSFLSRPLSNAVPVINGIESSIRLYPNPVFDELNINFTVTTGGKVRISLQDLLGREVCVISDKYASGTEEIQFNTSAIPDGLYLVRLQSGSESVTRKVQIR